MSDALILRIFAARSAAVDAARASKIRCSSDCTTLSTSKRNAATIRETSNRNVSVSLACRLSWEGSHAERRDPHRRVQRCKRPDPSSLREVGAHAERVPDSPIMDLESGEGGIGEDLEARPGDDRLGGDLLEEIDGHLEASSRFQPPRYRLPVAQDALRPPGSRSDDRERRFPRERSPPRKEEVHVESASGGFWPGGIEGAVPAHEQLMLRRRGPAFRARGTDGEEVKVTVRAVSP